MEKLSCLYSKFIKNVYNQTHLSKIRHPRSKKDFFLIYLFLFALIDSWLKKSSIASMLSQYLEILNI